MSDMKAPRMLDLRLLPVAVSVWLGTWLATWTPVSTTAAFVVAATSCGIGLVATAWWAVGRRAPPGRHAQVCGGSIRLGVAACCAGLACALAVGSAACHKFRSDPLVAWAADGGSVQVTVVVRLLDDPRLMGTRWSPTMAGADAAVLEVGRRGGVREPSEVRVLVQGTGWEGAARGDILIAQGRLDVGFRSEPPWVGTLRANDPSLLSRPVGWQGVVRRVRAALVDACWGLADQGKALVPGMAVGDDRAMGEELRAAMRTSSLAHLTAVSGSHIAIVLGTVSLVLPVRGRGRSVVIAGVLVVMVALVGPEPSVVRSVATSGVGVLGFALNRPGQSHAALAAVVVAVLLIDPWSARSVGFTLSVAATWGVIGPAAMVTRWALRRFDGSSGAGRIARATVAACAVPVACQLCVAPVLLLISPDLPAWGAVANVLAAPAVAPATLLALGATALAPVWMPGAQHLAVAASFFTGWVAEVAVMTSSWPCSRLEVPGGAPAAALVLTSVGLLATRWLWSRRTLEPV